MTTPRVLNNDEFFEIFFNNDTSSCTSELDSILSYICNNIKEIVNIGEYKSEEETKILFYERQILNISMKNHFCTEQIYNYLSSNKTKIRNLSLLSSIMRKSSDDDSLKCSIEQDGRIKVIQNGSENFIDGKFIDVSCCTEYIAAIDENLNLYMWNCYDDLIMSYKLESSKCLSVLCHNDSLITIDTRQNLVFYYKGQKIDFLSKFAYLEKRKNIVTCIAENGDIYDFSDFPSYIVYPVKNLDEYIDSRIKYDYPPLVSVRGPYKVNIPNLNFQEETTQYTTSDYAIPFICQESYYSDPEFLEDFSEDTICIKIEEFEPRKFLRPKKPSIEFDNIPPLISLDSVLIRFDNSQISTGKKHKMEENDERRKRKIFRDNY